jgi:hypothetical protein
MMEVSSITMVLSKIKMGKMNKEGYLDPKEKWGEIEKKIKEIEEILPTPVGWCEVYEAQRCQGCPITRIDLPCSHWAALFSRIIRDFQNFEQDVRMMKLLIEKAIEIEKRED